MWAFATQHMYANLTRPLNGFGHSVLFLFMAQIFHVHLAKGTRIFVQTEVPTFGQYPKYVVSCAG